MTSRDDLPKSAFPKKGEARAERKRRLANALRANLKRRKEQSRGRAEEEEPKKSEQEPGNRGDSE